MPTISWTNYLITMAVLTAIYYLVIGWIQFRHLLFTRKRDEPKIKTEVTNEPQELLGELFSQLSRIISVAAQYSSPQPELIFGLQQMIRRFQQGLQPGDEQKVNQYIVHELGKNQLEMSQDELEQLWKP